MQRSMPYSTFASRLRNLRLEHGWSQAQLSQRAKLTANHIAYLEVGDGEPNMETMRRLADAFGLTLSQLLEGVA